MYNSVVISSGHGKYVRGASGYIDEVDEARRVVDLTAEMLRSRNVKVKTFHDNTSHDVSTNLNTIVNYHNAQTRQLDISVHFNAYETTSKPMGVECLYVTQESLARQISAQIAMCGFPDRGPKFRSDLKFLNSTEMPAVLIETCFVDSRADADLYDREFEIVCDAIADVVGGDDAGSNPVPPDPPPAGEPLFQASGKVSWFGGPNDTGVSPSEGLAFIYNVDQAQHLFLPYQPSGTSGLARRLNFCVPFVACRWDYTVTPKPTLLQHLAYVRNPRTGHGTPCFPADWGPNENTGRVADVSRAVMEILGLETDDAVEVVYPWGEGEP
jgi:N-acetylmuramoyl-L-alanine amidase